ncbi:MAG: hypothetical protein ACJAWS_002335 [Oleiphilaceae bacterium]|jgi:uncharacterized protein (TIGR02444 family)
MTTQLPDDLQLNNDFWQFSLSLWRNNKVQEVLLRLQDTQHLRVNLLLFSLWLGIERKSIANHLLSILETTEPWHQQVVTPLRCVRQALPLQSPAPMLKPQVQNSELLAEQVEQALLFNCARKLPAATAKMNTNHPPDNTLSILIKNLIACTSHAQTIEQLNTIENSKKKNICTLSPSDLLLLVQACLPIHPESHISACIESLTTSQ